MGSKGFENDRVVGRELIEDVPIHCKIAENLPSYLAQDKRPFRRPRMVAAPTVCVPKFRTVFNVCSWRGSRTILSNASWRAQPARITNMQIAAIKARDCNIR